MKRKILMLFLGIGLLMAIENPIYKLIDKRGDIEIREYQSMIIAVTQVSLPYRSAQSEGFRRIANYIFGGNDQNMEIAMTAPVISSSPVNNNGIYNVSFVMPSKHTLSNLPKPNYENVIIKEHNLGKMAVLRFGGWATEDKVIKYQKRLEKMLIKKQHIIDGDFIVAQYNSPWVLPPFRKNEIMVRIK